MRATLTNHPSTIPRNKNIKYKRSLRRLCFYTCLSVILFTREVSASVHAGIPPPRKQTPREQTTPSRADTPRRRHAGRYGQQAGGMHATGMHTCSFTFLEIDAIHKIRTLESGVHFCILFVSNSLAGPWGGGYLGMHPLGPISFIFMQFSAKSCQIIGFRSKLRGWCSLWVILDPPLQLQLY